MRLREFYVIMVVVCLILSALCAGCQPVTAEYEGRQRTAAQIEAEVAAKVKAEQRAEELEAKQAAAAAKAAADEAERAQRALERKYSSVLRGVDRQHEEARVAASEDFQATADAIGVELSRSLANLTTARETAATTRLDRVEGIRAARDAALADIAAKEEARGAWANFAQGVIGDPAVSAAVGAVPGGGLISTILTGGLTFLGGVALRGKGSKARHDASWQDGFDAAKAEADAKALAADKAWEEAQKEMRLQVAELQSRKPA